MLKKYYRFHERRKEFYTKNPAWHTLISLGSLVFWLFVFKSTVLDANNIPSGSMEPTLMVGDFLFVNRMRYGINIPFTDKRFWSYDKPKRGDIVTFNPDKESPLDGKTLVKRVVGTPGDTIRIVDNEIIANGVRYQVREVQDPELLKQLGNSKWDLLNLYKETITEKKSNKPIVEHYILKDDVIKEYRRMQRFQMNESDFKFVFPPSVLSNEKYNVNLKKAFAPLRKATRSFITKAIISERSNHMRNPDREWVIPEGYYMVMGDNRDNSDDSRGCSLVVGEHNQARCRRADYPKNSKQWGLIPFEDIQGKVLLSYFSVNWGTKGETLGNPIENLFHLITGKFSGTYVRWNRIFNRIY